MDVLFETTGAAGPELRVDFSTRDEEGTGAAAAFDVEVCFAAGSKNSESVQMIRQKPGITSDELKGMN